MGSTARKSPPVYLSVRRAAELWEVSTATVYRQVRKGAIPHSRVGDTIRIPAEIVYKPLMDLIDPPASEAGA